MCSFGGVQPYSVLERDGHGQQGHAQNQPAQADVEGKKE